MNTTSRYDESGRLAAVAVNGVEERRYEYDANSNRVALTQNGERTTGSYDAQDRMLTYGDSFYTYSAAGELESRREGGRTTGFEYDSLGNLVRVELWDGKSIE